MKPKRRRPLLRRIQRWLRDWFVWCWWLFVVYVPRGMFRTVKRFWSVRGVRAMFLGGRVLLLTGVARLSLMVFRAQVRVRRVVAQLWAGDTAAGRFYRRVLTTCLVGLSLIGSAYYVLTRYLRSKEGLGQTYQAALETALRRSDWRGVLVYAKTLAAWRGPAPEYQFAMARAYDGLHQTQRAAAFLERIAPATRPGYAPAHLYQAEAILKAGPVDIDGYREAKAHLHHALSRAPNDARAHAWLGRIYMQEREWDLAEKHLKAAVDRLPEVQLDLALLYRQLRREADSARLAQLASKYFDQQLATNITDVQTRLAAAESRVIAGDYAGAAKLLEEGLTVQSDPVVAVALGRVYVAWSDRLHDDPMAALRLLEQAMKVSPTDLLLFDRFMVWLSDENRAAQARAVLEQQLAEPGGSTALAHLVLGTAAALKGDYLTAETHLRLSVEQDRRLLPAINNLAWVLAHRQDPQLDVALELIDPLVEKFPDNPYFRDTRGHILAKLGKWKEAVIDLEIAVTKIGAKQGTMRVIAEAYEQLGRPEMAEVYRRRAEAK